MMKRPLANLNWIRSRTRSTGTFRYRKFARACALSTFFIVASSILLSGTVWGSLYRYTAYESNDSAQELTRYYDMMQSYTSAFVPQIHALEPDFKALVYRNARAVYPYVTQEWEYFKAQKWVLKDRYGNYIYCKTYGPKEYMLVDIGNSAYQYWLANKIKSMIAQGGFDGVFLDNGFYVTTTAFWEASGTPINPRTQKPWTNLEVKNAYISILQKVKAAIGSKLLIPNGIWTGRNFYSTAEHNSILEVLQKTQLDGIMSEGTWYTYNLQWLTVDDWKKSLDFFIWIEENFLRGTDRVFVSIVCDNYNPPRESTHLQLATYSLASTLLGMSPDETHVCLHLGHTSFMADYGQALFDKANSLGNPTGNYYTRNGVYIRAFDHGKVYVNPTGSPLSAEGITIKAHTGIIVTDSIDRSIGTLTVTSPNGGESWVRGTTHPITWTSIGSAGANVKIQLLKSEVVKGTITTANDGSYSWTIGTSNLGTDYKIRITSTSNPAITDSSNSDFAITADGAGALTVTSPNGGESWKRGTTHATTWMSTGSAGANVKIQLLKSEVVKGTITTANDGSYSWTIGTSNLGTDYKIRITSTSNPAITDSSNSNFAITT